MDCPSRNVRDHAQGGTWHYFASRYCRTLTIDWRPLLISLSSCFRRVEERRARATTDHGVRGRFRSSRHVRMASNSDGGIRFAQYANLRRLVLWYPVIVASAFSEPLFSATTARQAISCQATRCMTSACSLLDDAESASRTRFLVSIAATCGPTIGSSETVLSCAEVMCRLDAASG
jgi:hypothetical protein